MTADLNAVTPELRAAAKKAEEEAGNITDTMTTLMTALEPMLTGLKGMAGNKFQEVQGGIQQNLKVIVDNLMEVSSGVSSSGVDFDVNDEEAAQAISASFAEADDVYDRLAG